MKMRKVLSAFLAVICMFTAVGFCGPAASAATTDTVYAETSTSLRQGDYGYCYIYLDDLTDLAALAVTVYYDADKVSLLETYNQVSCTLYDSSNQPGSLQYSYIFSGDGESAKTNLFYFCYRISENAPIGESYFDIVVSDAYDASLEVLPICGSRCSFTITEGVTQQQCTIYGPSGVTTAVEEIFALNYSVSTSQIASGALSIHYDPELVEFVDLTPGGLLSNKAVDVNASLPGTVYVSFVGTEYDYDSSLLQIRFRTLKNEETTTQIQLAAADLCDLSLQSIQCTGCTTTVSIAYDASYTEDAPSMKLSASYNEQTEKVTVVVMLDADSHLGAGDFVLKYDPSCLTYCSATKGFAPTFFNINDKQVEDGVLKFSIISLADIVDAQTVLTIEFDAIRTLEDQLVEVEITGSGLTNALTNPIVLNFVNANVQIPLRFIYGDANGDGTISLMDVLMLRKYLANRNIETNESTMEVEAGADANGDGSIDLRDVLLLRRYLANRDPDTDESTIVLGPQTP